jgi:hypothetical protein
MFLRHKRIGKYTYVYLVESVYQDGRTRQHIIRNLGRREDVEAGGDLERLAASAARLSRKALVLSAEARGAAPVLGCRRVGPGLVFERLWTETGCRAVIEELARDRKFGFAIERAVFLTVVHRLMVSGSDRAADKWRQDYAIEGADDLRLHQLYRTMAWLGEPLAADDGTASPPRCVKHLIEEALFAHRRDLFSTLDVVFMDTTSLFFEGAGGETLGRRGYSKDHRPDLNQMVLSVVLDGEGRPICSETWPGNTADITTLMAIVDRLKERFAIRRVCVVADRGMISAATIAALEERKLEYILGVRERTDKLVREVVLADEAPFVPLAVDKRGKTTELGAKEVKIGSARYIVCVNHGQAAKDAADRAAILESLARQLKRGDKALVGNTGYRRYLRTLGEDRFAIDRDKVAADEKFDGVFVLRTNTALGPIAAMLRYKQLWTVEQVFRTTKDMLGTRPIYHKRDETIRGHVFCSFLALVLKKALTDRLAARGAKLEWAAVLADLDRVQEVELAHEGKRVFMRTPLTGTAGKVFQATRVALPPVYRDIEPAAQT